MRSEHIRPSENNGTLVDVLKKQLKYSLQFFYINICNFFHCFGKYLRFGVDYLGVHQ